ncbi:BlaI/MecI/CopY family transcriptional regulator [Clostridium thermosuccinogenes]|uniref:BlaI/MecI/CopY family transcriptional regulator n=1 Tax=Clostridium thermosuccinogenes TaxID=84032 RepID=A0A2K2FJE8_9CLOT|nr:BlaI/MecI/CopY family transcriptional regulator [Pseudoclostridium thermosuccinogenes]AUS98416.1 BlaI/MecI/CopY family transcriptional regulator [Pseudoclostridium thermosuccinogenes]PNT90935.1 BlaI/MecI/CopY family transcriptional regulator [Pseudoclostridium thermosuccinogenes]PNT98904.1 BlaI/MecI/CopY family transcriptional regulator [Pseudoclostridium thermosuccinogenes]PNU00819.1 BlaI/MecI/CopY family transcriptional regulator [Pseudoclostridium thermosuccinogenes]
MKQYKLFDAEFKFMCIVWESEPLTTRRLTELCREKLGWKRTTTYTVLRKLIDRGILKNENSVVTSVVKREQVQKYESEAIIEKAFDGSLPKFIAAFLNDRTLSDDEAEEIKRLIDSHKEG